MGCWSRESRKKGGNGERERERGWRRRGAEQIERQKEDRAKDSHINTCRKVSEAEKREAERERERDRDRERERRR